MPLHVRLRLQRQAIEAMGAALRDDNDGLGEGDKFGDGDDEPDDPPILVPA